MSVLRNASRRNPGVDVDRLPDDYGHDDVLVRDGRLLSTEVTAFSSRQVMDLDDTAHEEWARRETWGPFDDTTYALDPADGGLYEAALNADVVSDEPMPGAAPKKTYIRSKVSKRPHVVWKELYRQEFLDELLRSEGRGDFIDVQTCRDCQARKAAHAGAASYRCKECATPDLVCAPCCVRRHRSHPFHRIQKWDGVRFETVSLKSLGAFFQLNHSGNHCDLPVPAHRNMLVLHTNGIHDVAIKYCGCSRAIPHHLQLLRRRIYPASQITIRTGATFELLDQLHMLALTTKSNTYDFYRALEKLTVNTGIDAPKSRYRALMRMILQWRHLMLLKRGGRGNEPSGAEGTAAGELAVLCPSCPRPGINLGDEVKGVPPALLYLYTVFLCMDANFRLKNQVVSNYSQDPGLGTGWAYMVSRQLYEEYCLKRASDSDISTCVGFQALAKANTKFSKGLRYTGVGMVSCGRSEMIMPVAVGNLQKGERYANMDYIFASVLQALLFPLVLVSYDICCQWFVNLFKRMNQDWPQAIRPTQEFKMTPAIPKMHEPAHGKANHEKFSLNFIPGVGHSDLEGPERIWSAHNALGNATKTQGPGSRQDVLDDHFSFWNWSKYVNLGVALAARYKHAVADRNNLVEGHRGLTDSVDDEETVNRWENMCTKWENAPFPKSNVKNPYALEGITLTETQVRTQLQLEDEQSIEDGEIPLHDTSPSAFIVMGLELEEQQRRVRRLAKSAAPKDTTSKKAGDLAAVRKSLRLRIRTWEKLLSIYLPGLLQFQDDLEKENAGARPKQARSSNTVYCDAETSQGPASEHPEDAILWLPSRLPKHARRRVCREGLPRIEEKLRDVQLSDTLETIRHILRVKARMVAFKNKNHRGQREGTRSRTAIDRVHDKALSAAEKYREARHWKVKIASNADWENRFQPLANSDIRGYQDPNKMKTYVGRRGVFEDDQLDAVRVAQAAESAHAAREMAGAAPADFDLDREDRAPRNGTGETRRTLSWIWTVEGVQHVGADESSDDILRVEWCKSRARANRATEEVLLLKEEMRRTLAFLEYRAKWWKDKPTTWSGVSRQLTEGLAAYAARQASLQEALHGHFKLLWEKPLTELSTTAASSTDDDAGDDNDDEGDDLFDDHEAVNDNPWADDEDDV